MNSYDQLPYPNLSFVHTHPDQLATLATLLGMSPAPVERCRFLEMGCAGGGNLLPMAWGLPGSTFVGFDLSAVQIAQGQESIRDLGLKNLTLKQMDILDVDAGLGEFDYIVAHGVYSWVPPEVQDKIIQICKQNLAPDGVAYVSYNTYPGWHMIEIVRGLMLFESRGVEDPLERAARGRAGLRQLAELAAEDSPYGFFLRNYAQLIDGALQDTMPKSNSLLYHDEMSEFNMPLYFYQFAERAASQGLQYLGDLYHGRGGDVPASTRETLQSKARSHVELEQYLDFLQNRTFRQTLLCHDHVALNRSVKVEQGMGFYVASRARPMSDNPDIGSRAVERFEGHDGATLAIDHPVSKAAMLCLAEAWPRVVPFAELLAAARARLGLPSTGDDLDAKVLSANLLRAYGYSHSLIELHLHAPRVATRPGERPEATAVARYLVAHGMSVTNIRHERLTPDPFLHYLLPYLDGSRDREALLDLLFAGPVADGLLQMEHDGHGAFDPREALAVELESSLNWAARAALLVEPSPSGDKL